MQEVRLPGCGIVLLHPFAGGVFSFRLIMGTLAEDVGCPVLSFDRPGAGLVKLFLIPVALCPTIRICRDTGPLQSKHLLAADLGS